MYLLADLGGTKMRIATSADLETFNEPVIFDTPATYEEGIDAIKSSIAGATIESVAVGMPGLFSRDKRTVIGSIANMPTWLGKNVAEDLEKITNTLVCIENDAALVGLGEAAHGAGRGARVVMYLTVSTGVNGIRIVDAKLDENAPRPSLGYQYLSTTEPLTKLEDLISGKAIENRYGKHPKDLGKQWEGWEDLARLAAFALHNAILHWSPDRIVLGGSMFNEIGISFERVKAHVAEIFQASPEMPEIVHSELGDLGGLYGGMARLRQLK